MDMQQRGHIQDSIMMILNIERTATRRLHYFKSFGVSTGWVDIMNMLQYDCNQWDTFIVTEATRVKPLFNIIFCNKTVNKQENKAHSSYLRFHELFQNV